jgi:hypothetical protein
MKVTASSPPARRRQAWLVVLLLVLAGVLWLQLRPTPSPAATSNPVAVGSAPAPVVALPERVALDTLAEVPELPEARRNPFAFGVRPPPPPPPPQQVLAPTPTAPPPPPPPSGPPPIALRLTGLTRVSDTGRTMVTLKDPSSSAIYQAFEGDIVDGRYRVVKVGTGSIVVSYLDGSGTRTIPLGG